MLYSIQLNVFMKYIFLICKNYYAFIIMSNGLYIFAIVQ